MAPPRLARRMASINHLAFDLSSVVEPITVAAAFDGIATEHWRSSAPSRHTSSPLGSATCAASPLLADCRDLAPRRSAA